MPKSVRFVLAAVLFPGLVACGSKSSDEKSDAKPIVAVDSLRARACPRVGRPIRNEKSNARGGEACAAFCEKGKKKGGSVMCQLRESISIFF